jgi:endonuclease/exonuclease/phosphatase family metal-dependent hydrolase
MALNPDILAVQEARVPEKTAEWLAQKLGSTYIFLSTSPSQRQPKEGIALISRIPFTQAETLDLESQNRVAQSIHVSIDDKEIRILNGHFYWQPGESPERDRQIEKLIHWVKTTGEEVPSIICGDFNATPETNAIKRMKELYQSAYSRIHGKEPDYTAPTPLPHSFRYYLGTAISFSKYLRLKEFSLHWRGTLDYIFVDSRLTVLDSQLVLNKPAPGSTRIFPSDHFGIFAEIQID